MTQSELNQLLPYFEQYHEGTYKSYFLQKEIPCKKYMHKEHDSFQIIILKEESGHFQVYQTNSDHEIQGVELVTFENAEIRFKSFTGDEIENVNLLV